MRTLDIVLIVVNTALFVLNVYAYRQWGQRLINLIAAGLTGSGVLLLALAAIIAN